MFDNFQKSPANRLQRGLVNLAASTQVATQDLFGKPTPNDRASTLIAAVLDQLVIRLKPQVSLLVFVNSGCKQLPDDDLPIFVIIFFHGQTGTWTDYRSESSGANSKRDHFAAIRPCGNSCHPQTTNCGRKAMGSQSNWCVGRSSSVSLFRWASASTNLP